MKTTIRPSPVAYNFYKSFKIRDRFFKLSFSIDPYDVIRHFRYDGPGENSHHFTKMQHIAQGNKIDAVLNKEITSFDIYLFLLQESLREYKNPYRQTNDKPHLICRCFNVSQGEIEKALKEQGYRNIHQVTLHLRAGGGCTRCLSDIKKLMMENN